MGGGRSRCRGASPLALLGGCAALCALACGAGEPDPGPSAPVLYDRTGSTRATPFPDDFWLRPDPESGEPRLRVEIGAGDEINALFFESLLADTRALDGFSPIAPLIVELSAAADPATLPLTPMESVDAGASVGLFDLTPGSPGFGARVPFRLEARSDRSWGHTSHTLIVFPSVSLAPGGRYGLVVTRRARALDGRPFGPSEFFRRIRDGAPAPAEGAPPAQTPASAEDRARALAGEVLDALEHSARPPLPRGDVALALRISVRSEGALPADLLAIREALWRAAPPPARIRRVQREGRDARARGSRVAAVVEGAFDAPDFRNVTGNLARDRATGRPVRTGARSVPFVLALPDAAWNAPVPVVFYQHGNPGSAEEEVVAQARRSLAQEGFAVIGFTDPLNREVSPPGPSDAQRAHDQVADILWRLVASHSIPDYFSQTNAEQLAFLRVIEGLAQRGRFELDDPGEEEPEWIHGIDPDAPLTYLGVSEGAHHAPALLALAPQIRAAALVAGGRRFTEVLMQQQPQTFLAPLFLVGFQRPPADVWVVLSLLQTVLDSQDGHNYAPFLYRRPLDLGGSKRRASILLQEGLGDSLVPNHVTEALARALGPIPLIPPTARRVLGLPLARTPLSGNIDADTTAALAQFAPTGLPGVQPSPGCQSPPLTERSAWEGHYCVQNAEEAVRQRAAFLRSALGGGAPVIDSPESD